MKGESKMTKQVKSINNATLLLQKRKGARTNMSTADAIKAVYAFKHPNNELNDIDKIKSLSDSKKIYRDGETQSAKPRAPTKEDILHQEKMLELEQVNNRPPTRNDLINTNYYLNEEEERRAKEEEERKKRKEDEERVDYDFNLKELRNLLSSKNISSNLKII